MTPDEIRQLCQALRAEGVKRVRLGGDNQPISIEFFASAASMPTDEERGRQPSGPELSGYETAATLLARGGGRVEGGRA